jgi:hypothetical protein
VWRDDRVKTQGESPLYKPRIDDRDRPFLTLQKELAVLQP